MRDGTIGILGTGGTYLLQDISLVLSITCAVVTLVHFGFVFRDRFKGKK